jgi:hypothetical protein
MEEQSTSKAVYLKDEYWAGRGSSKLLTYVGPPLEKNIDQETIKEFIRKKKALGAIWSYDYDYAQEGPWYRCVCDTPEYDLEKIKSRYSRRNIRRGLNKSVIRQIDNRWLGDNGYEVYIKATIRYKHFKPLSKENFSKRMYKRAENSNTEAFGAFVDDKLVAYVTLLITGQRVLGDYAHFDPEYSWAYPMYALLYTATNYYLNERDCKEFSRGTRPLLHETNVDDFLLRLGFRISYCRLGLYLRLPVRIFLGFAKFSRVMFKLILPSRQFAILESLLLAQDIAKNTELKANHT